MREIVCAVCGAKCIDTSYAQNKIYCSKRCANRVKNSRRAVGAEAVCRYNDGVKCAEHQCDRCGWCPAVEKERKAKLGVVLQEVTK
jgi:hypothetical protein